MNKKAIKFFKVASFFAIIISFVFALKVYTTQASTVTIVKVSGIDTPVVGKTLDTTGTVPSTATTYVSSIRWSPSDTTAQGGKQYKAYITVRIKSSSSNSFSQSSPPKVTVNGSTAAIYSVDYREIVAIYTFPQLDLVTTKTPVIKKLSCESSSTINIKLQDVKGASIETEVCDAKGKVLNQFSCNPTTHITAYTNADPETKYKIRVRYTGSSNPWSKYTWVKTPKYENIKTLTLNSKSDKALKLSWSNSVYRAADYYNVYRANNGSKKYKFLKKVSGKKTNYTDKKVKNGKVYQYKIVAYKKFQGKLKKSNATYSVKRSPIAAPKYKGAVIYPVKIGGYGEPSAKDYYKGTWSKVKNVSGYQMMTTAREKDSKPAYKKFRKNVNKYTIGIKNRVREVFYDTYVRAYKIIKGKKYYSEWSNEVTYIFVS